MIYSLQDPTPAVFISEESARRLGENLLEVNQDVKFYQTKRRYFRNALTGFVVVSFDSACRSNIVTNSDVDVIDAKLIGKRMMRTVKRLRNN